MLPIFNLMSKLSEGGLGATASIFTQTDPSGICFESIVLLSTTALPTAIQAPFLTYVTPATKQTC